MSNWIKFEANTPDKTEVWQIAQMVRIDADAVVGKLLRIWVWFDEHTEDGSLRHAAVGNSDNVSGNLSGLQSDRTGLSVNLSEKFSDVSAERTSLSGSLSGFNSDNVSGSLSGLVEMTRANKTLGNIANDQTVTNGNASSVTVPLAFDAFSATKMLLDRRVGVIGFCDAMIAVGWMQELNGKISLPNFDRHNGKTAKTRALTAKRVSSHKMGKSKGNASSVSLGNATSVSDALPRIEQNRIDNKNKKQTKLDCPIGNHLGDTSFLAIWGKWRDHLSERFKPLTPTTEETQLYKLSEFSVNEAIAIVEFSIGAGAVNLILNGDHKRKASRSAKATSFDEVF